MQTTLSRTPNGGATALLRLLLIVMFLMAMIAAITISLPFTSHGGASHVEQTWNATTIVEHINSGKCLPTEYSCVAKDFDVVYCEIKPGLSIGLIIGHTVKQIVTGFAAQTKYWERRCD